MTLFYKNAVICGLHNNELVPIRCNDSGYPEIATGDFATNIYTNPDGTLDKSVIVGLFDAELIALQCNENGEIVS